MSLLRVGPVSYIRRRILKSGKPRYYPVLTQGDREEYIGGGFDRKKDAEARLAREISERAAGRKTALGFTAWSETWLNSIIKVSPQTKKDYRIIVERHLAPRFKARNLNEIQPEDVDRMVTDLEETLKPATVLKVLTVLRMLLKAAQARGYISSNPASFSKPPRQEHSEKLYLDWSEAKALLEVAPPVVSVALLSGMRQGEILALRAGDILEGAILVRRSWNPEFGYGLPKNRQQRTVQIGPELEAILAEACEGKEPDDLLFEGKYGNPIHPTYLLRKVFKPALTEAKVKSVRYHDLRHTYASMMIALGCNIKYLQKQLGHKSIKVTYDTYGHLFPEVDAGLVEALETRLTGISRERTSVED